jgi:ISXO2-like transposase domain
MISSGETVSSRVDLIATDESFRYRHLNQMGFKHDFVTHKNDEFVRGKVHTQTIESFWSLLRRGIMGSYHKVSRNYLPLYLAEFSFRYNNRKNPDMFGELLSGC